MASSTNAVPGSTSPGNFCVCFVTGTKENVAKKIARRIVGDKLGASFNIVARVTSMDECNEKLEEEPEVVLTIKSQSSGQDELNKSV